MSEFDNVAAVPQTFAANREQSTTRFGKWGSNITTYCGWAYVLTGIAGLMGGLAFNSGAPYYNKFEVEAVIGVFSAIVLGASMILYERMTRDNAKTDDKNLRKTLVQVAVAIPGFLAFPTTFASCLILVAASVNLVSSFIYVENYPAPRAKRARGADVAAISCSEKMLRVLGGKNPEGRTGRIIILVIYITGNLIAGTVNYVNTDAARGKDGVPNWTDWVLWAKFFGNIMNFNFTFLLIPVSRNLIRWLYNNSTADRSNFSIFLKTLLTFIPLDQSRKMHILCAWVGFWACVGHVFAHLINYAKMPDDVWKFYGASVWFTGVPLIVIMLLLFTATHANVKRAHFEIFWATHMLFPLFILLNLLHGKGWWGPNYWKWLLVPGGIYTLERTWREYTSLQEAALVSVTFMSNNVMSLKLAKIGAFKDDYREGQYAYLCCPHISKFEWHPLTISSAPQDPCVTFHIRVQGPGSWTHKLQQYMLLFTKKNESYHDFSRMTENKQIAGKIKGPDGLQMLRVYGPHSAPSQHLTEYFEAMICTSGIGVTPLAASMTSIVLYRWRQALGRTYPEKVHFFWVTSYTELQSFRWFVRCVKEVEEVLQHLYESQEKDMRNKLFEFNIYVTSYKPENYDKSFDDVEDRKLDEKEDVRYWGAKRTAGDGIVFGKAPFTECELYAALLRPKEDKSKQTLGHVTVTHARPKWNRHFEDVCAKTTEKDIGVIFCGNPGIGKDLTDMASQYTGGRDGLTFHVHKEVF